MPESDEPLKKPTAPPRALIHKTPELRARVIHIKDTFYSGNLSKFATALNVNYRHLQGALYDRGKLTPGILAQIVARTNIRAEWLLTGAGPMLLTEDNRDEPAFELPVALNSVFPVFNTLSVPNTPHKAARPAVRTKTSNNAVTAARVVYACRSTGRPVCFFLGATVSARPNKMRRLVHELFQCGYCTSFSLTGGALQYELPRKKFDINFVARAAAISGVGLGEAISRWTSKIKKNRGLFTAALGTKIPITVHAEIGEHAGHLKPGLRGAELGAVWGAALYADYLVFVEHVRQFVAAGGTFIVCGEPDRGVRLFMSTLQTVCAASASNELAQFAIINIGPTTGKLQRFVRRRGGHFYHIKGTYSAAMSKFLHACADVYEGKTL